MSPDDLSFGDLPHTLPDDETPGRGTTRPHAWVKQPREESQRAIMRERRDTDVREEIRIAWLVEVQEYIESTSAFKDHWKDPRWDEHPPEWEFKPWLARKIRGIRLTVRGSTV
jgi:hypothetical protein